MCMVVAELAHGANHSQPRGEPQCSRILRNRIRQGTCRTCGRDHPTAHRKTEGSRDDKEARIARSAYEHYDKRRAAGDHHNAALRNLANKLLGRLWWCLANNQLWDDNAAWPHRPEHPNPVAA
jgi:hypothetical protein